MAHRAIDDLVKVMARLRGPNGCPWDREQTHTSLLKYLREESAELCEAVEKKKNWFDFKDELGDVLLQVIFHARMAEERGAFNLNDVARHLSKKLIGRHPHVFGKKAKGMTWTSADVKANWNDLKKQEAAWKDKEARRLAKRMKGKKLV